MGKRTILIIIDTLRKGGAEMLLAGILPDLNKEFEVILVTLSPECDFHPDQVAVEKRYVLGFTGKMSFIGCIFRLRKIIRRHQPHLVHSHLIYSTLLARLACPSKIPLLFSIHNELSKNAFDESSLLRFLEKATFRKRQVLIAVSDTVLRDYEETIGLPDKAHILKNYISDHFFDPGQPAKNPATTGTLRMVALGNVKNSKNYFYLLRSLIYLNDPCVSLDIYGNTDSPLFSPLQELIDQHHLNARFRGPAAHVRDIFSNYDLYVMGSTHEGFGIAAVEAMACGLPLLLSDLPVLREVTFNNALFFNLNNPEALSDLIREVISGKHNLRGLSEKGTEIAKQYARQRYLEELVQIYHDIPGHT